MRRTLEGRGRVDWDLFQLPRRDVTSVSYAHHAHVYQPGWYVVSANTTEREDEKVPTSVTPLSEFHPPGGCSLEFSSEPPLRTAVGFELYKVEVESGRLQKGNSALKGNLANCNLPDGPLDSQIPGWQFLLTANMDS